MVPRFYCPQPLTLGRRLVLPSDIAHHAIRVLRLRVGDEIALFTGEGGEYGACIVDAGRDVVVEIHDFAETEREAPIELTLVQALPAADKMDWIVQKAVELGCARIVPVLASRSVVRLAGERAMRRAEHWRGVAQSACEQCGRNRLPVVDEIIPLPDFLAASQESPALRLALVPGAEQPIGSLARPDAGAMIMVGPEGGFAEGELAAIAACGWRSLSLGPRVLRTETAGLAALSAVLVRWGDF